MTYSTNFGNPSIEATNYNSLQFILEQLPDNTGQFISPRDVRDAVFTTWEKGVFKTIELGSETYIGTDNGGTVSNFRYKMFLGKKQLQSGNDVLNSTLLTSDTDLFIYNNKSDSNLSQQDTKVSFLAGDDFSLFTDAPYLEATKISGSPSRINLNITNPSSGGIVEINSDIIELGDTNGWIVDDTSGSLYPQNNSQNIGLTGVGNRIGTIYMASTVDYLNDLEFISGTSPSITFDTDGKITTDYLHVKEDLQFKISAPTGYFLSTDSSGNATWGPGKINTIGITAGYMNVADGSDDVNWVRPYADATGITSGYILQAVGGSSPYGASGIGVRPEWKNLNDLSTPGVTAGFVLGSDGSNSVWVENTTFAGGSTSNVQFNNAGFIDGDSDFTWNNSTNVLTVNGSGTFSDVFLSNRLWSADSSNSIDMSNPYGGGIINFGGGQSVIGANTKLSFISDTLEFESPTFTSFLVEDQGFQVEADDSPIRLLTSNGSNGIIEMVKDNDNLDINLRYQTGGSPTGTMSSIRSVAGTTPITSNIYSSISFHERLGGGEISFGIAETPSTSEPSKFMTINATGIGINEENPSELFNLAITEESKNTLLIDSQISATQSININFVSDNGANTNRKNFSISVDKDLNDLNIFSINTLDDNLTLIEKTLQIVNSGNPSVGIKGSDTNRDFYVNGDVRFDGQLETQYAVRRLNECRLNSASGTFSANGEVYDENLIFAGAPFGTTCPFPFAASPQVYDEYRIMDTQKLEGNKLYFQNLAVDAKDIVSDSGAVIVPHDGSPTTNSITISQGESVMLIWSIDRWFVFKLN